MKTKKILALFVAIVICLSSITIFADNKKSKDKLEIFYNDEIINFDVEPVVENGRTLVPMRMIFETMGCAVYYTEDAGKHIVSARRANDSLLLTIGENKMYFSGKEIALDVPAKIKNNRTLVPLRAISEAFECEVLWDGSKNVVNIYSPSNAYEVSAEKITETIKDDNGNVLIEAVAYYPAIENPTAIPCIDAINLDYKMDADKFMEEARGAKEDALSLKKEMGKAFIPFVYELTYEQTYGELGYLSFVNHKYINVGGVHPTKIMESRTYNTSSEEDISVSDVIKEDSLDASLSQYITNLFVDKLKEIDPESADIYTYDYVKENIGYLQFYLTKNSLVLYFNQGELAHYALGVISVEIPYDPQLFDIDMKLSDENVIYPLPETIDINALDNCTVPISLKKGDAYVDDTGKMVMNVMVYSYELYDMVDIASLKENDVIVHRGEKVKVTEIIRLKNGCVLINGGEENGGFELISNESTAYYETGMDDIKSYYELGKVILPVSTEFRYVDESDIEAEAKTYYPGDFLIADSEIEYNFSPFDTSIVIEDGTIVKMNKGFMP